MNIYFFINKLYKKSCSIITLLIILSVNFDASSYPLNSFTGEITLTYDLQSAQQIPKTNQPKRILINPKVKIRQQQQNPKVTLQSDRDRIQIYEEVRFSLEPAEYVVNSRYQFIFIIDGNIKREMEKNLNYIVYRFNRTGKHTVTVSVEAPKGSEIFTFKPVVTNRLQVQVDSVLLNAIPENVIVEQPVTFQIIFHSNMHNLRYRFFFGDSDSYSEWLLLPRTTHIYSKQGKYRAYAEIGIQEEGTIRKFTRSIIRKVLVENPESTETPTVKIKLIADRNKVQTGEKIRFILSPPDVVMELSYDFIFNFDDGNRLVKKPGQAEILHRFKNAGNYTVSVQVQPGEQITDLNIVPQMENSVDIQVDSVFLNINPNSTKTGEDITFETEFPTDDPQIRYRFFFGDNSPPSRWSNRSSILHRYPSPNIYYAYAEIGRQSGSTVMPITRSVGRFVNISSKTIVSDKTKYPPWIYLIIILIAAAVFYSIGKHYIAPRAQLKPRIDPGKQDIAGGNKLSINYELRLNPNIHDGIFNILLNNKDIIKNIKREHE